MKGLIKNYVLKNHKRFGFDRINSLGISFLARGEYNINYLVSVNCKKFVFRINLYQQSGLKEQVKYEYKTLKFLEDFGITPRVCFMDDSKSFFDNDLLIYEYCEGRELKPTKEDVKAFAKALFILHSIKIPKAMNFMKRDFLKGDREFITKHFNRYKKISDDRETVRILEKAIKSFLNKKINLPCRWSLIHTDTNPGNVIFNSKNKKAILIDWEKGRIDDPSWDICGVLCPISSIWPWGRKMNESLKKYFIENYKGFEYDPYLWKKVNARYPIVLLWFTLWTAQRISEIKRGKVDKRNVSSLDKYNRILKIGLEELRCLLRKNPKAKKSIIV